MKELLECGECGEVFSSEEALKKHAGFQHGKRNVEIKEGVRSGGFLSGIWRKLRGK
ncbi:MAG: hypothetical protein ABEJ87_01345 [Candidatus Nanohalobium sp.]